MVLGWRPIRLAATSDGMKHSQNAPDVKGLVGVGGGGNSMREERCCGCERILCFISEGLSL